MPHLRARSLHLLDARLGDELFDPPSKTPRLIDGTILSLIVRTTDYATVHQELQGVPIVAGRGYAAVTVAGLLVAALLFVWVVLFGDVGRVRACACVPDRV